jgi:hypothetical protein
MGLRAGVLDLVADGAVVRKCGAVMTVNQRPARLRIWNCKDIRQ